jgi:L-rhamnose mutarotase
VGIEEMEIYRSGNRLVMVMDTTEDFDPGAKAAADAVNPDVIAWEELMDRFQQPLSWAPAGTKWLEADRIFALSEQSGAQRGTGDSQPGTY